MSKEPLIKLTKKDGSTHLVPASQRKTYESLNARYKKLNKLDEIVEISDFKEKDATAGTPGAPPSDSAETQKHNAADVVKAIGECKTIEEVDKLAVGDDRATVQKAAEKKKESLAQ